VRTLLHYRRSRFTGEFDIAIGDDLDVAAAKERRRRPLRPL
jgi:hypothetical protein